METGTIVMMAIVLTIVWGGFTVLIVRGMRIDRRRRRQEAESDGIGDRDEGGGETDA